MSVIVDGNDQEKEKIRNTLIIAFLVQNKIDCDVKYCVLMEIKWIKQSKRIFKTISK